MRRFEHVEGCSNPHRMAGVSTVVKADVQNRLQAAGMLQSLMHPRCVQDSVRPHRAPNLVKFFSHLETLMPSLCGHADGFQPPVGMGRDASIGLKCGFQKHGAPMIIMIMISSNKQGFRSQAIKGCVWAAAGNP